MAKQALGKGLGALIKKQGQSTALTSTNNNGEPDNEVRKVAISQVVPSPLQPRKQFTEGQLDDLMDSIKQHGIIQPLIVRKVGETLELIAGERRWRASTNLGLKTVPVIIRDASDRDVLEMALIENLQREDLNPIEEAAGYVRLSKEFKIKQDKIAERVGKSRASVANAMRLLDLPTEVQDLLIQRLLTVGHAKAILSLKDPKVQLIAAQEIIKKGLTVRAAEKLAQDFKKQRSSKDKVTAPDNTKEAAAISKIQKRLESDFGTRVNLHHTPKKGRIEIEYYGKDDLNRVLDLLGISPQL